MKEMVCVKEIFKQFDSSVIIPGLDLTINDGEFITFLGPSGCGKTTLLRMIAGLEQPTSGSIFLDGKDVTNLPPYKRDVNMVFQQYALFPHMTVEDNIKFGLKMKNVAAAEQQQRVDQVISLTQLEELRYRRPKQLSGGQQQRVAIARAVVNNPKVLLLDEPLGALDYQLRKSLQLELKSLQKRLGLTFIYVTHDQEEALTMSDRIVVMNKGVIEQDSDPNTIYHSPATKFVAEFIGESNFLTTTEGVIALRPEKIYLSDENEDLESKLPNYVPHPKSKYFGKITDIVFYGTLDKVFIELDESKEIVIAYQYFDDIRRWQVNERVGLWWYPQDEVRLAR